MPLGTKWFADFFHPLYPFRNINQTPRGRVKEAPKDYYMLKDKIICSKSQMKTDVRLLPMVSSLTNSMIHRWMDQSFLQCAHSSPF